MLNKLNLIDVKTTFLKLIVFLASFLSPIIGILVLWVQNKKESTTYKKVAWAGMIIAFVLFFADYIVFMMNH